MKISDYLDDWLADRSVAQSTYEKNQYHVRHINENLGHLDLDRLSFNEVERFYRALDKDMATSTVRSIAGTLSGAMSEAVRRGLIDDNPCRKASPPSPDNTSSTFDVLNENEAKQLKNRLTIKSAYDMAIFLMLDTGMRKSEAIGLKWDNVDFDNQFISVVETLVRTPGGDYQFSEPKTKASKRSVSLSDHSIELLREHKAHQESLKAEASGWPFPELSFTTKKGDHLKVRTISDRLSTLNEDLGISDVSPHELRHTHATLLLRQGVHPKKVQERLGHGSIEVTLDRYSHVAPDMQSEVAEQFSKIYQ